MENIQTNTIQDQIISHNYHHTFTRTMHQDPCKLIMTLNPNNTKACLKYKSKYGGVVITTLKYRG